MTTPTEAKARVAELTRLLEQYEYEYYVLNAPTVSDRTFDLMMKELEELEDRFPELCTPYSPTQRVGSEFVLGATPQVGQAVPHRTPMLSLSNTYSWGEVETFYRRVGEAVGRATEVVAELKFDGASISVVYENGVLRRALTRGDGTNGEDITPAIKAIRSVPLRLRGSNLPYYVEVRGEVLLPWTEFERLNREREKNELPLFANPRNAVSGTIKTKDNVAEVIAQRRPTVFFYYLLSDDERWLPNLHHDRLERMQDMGLRVSNHSRICSTPEELHEYLEYWDVHRHHLEVATDGVVVKVDDYRLHDEIGWTAKSPKWAMAYKFSAERAVTRLLSVSYQTARTGVVTPVANLEPVQLSGTTVQRASLHNADIIRELDLHIGDLVSVEKGGEIIPKITEVRTDLRDNLVQELVEMPSQCPSCGHELVRVNGLAATICPNEWECPAQVEGKIEHFCSRKAMDINIGPKTIHLLCVHLGVQEVSALYALTVEQLTGLPGFQRQKALNLVQSIESSKSVPFDKVLFAIGIKLIGSQVASKLAKHFKSIDRLFSASIEEIQAVDDIGPMIAESIRSFAEEEHNRRIIERLREIGLRLEISEEGLQGKEISDTFVGQTVVISGTFESISRDELKELLTKHGAKVGSGITGKTTLFITGDNVGPSKLQKALQLGITPTSESEFFDRYPNIRK